MTGTRRFSRTLWAASLVAMAAFMLPCLGGATGSSKSNKKVQKPAEPSAPQEPACIAPLLRKLMTEYAATGLPPAYIPKEEK